jgi:predicted Zn finger-like uncharacterized protein
LIIQCTSCGTRYHYDEARFGTASMKRIRCTKCPTIFEIRNPAMAVPGGEGESRSGGPPSVPVLTADDFSLDVTAMGGGPRKRPVQPATAAVSMPMAAAPAPVPMPRAVPSPVSVPSPSSAGQAPWASLVAQRAPAPSGSQTGSYQAPAAPRGGGEARRLKLPDWERLSLACIAGPDSGRIFEIDRPRVVIGRANADILLSDAECSRQHAAIEVAEERAFLIDLGSTNGTYVGERAIQEYPLESRTEFDVGASTLMFLRSRRD